MPDPANPQSLNRYSYVLNNPLLYTDPSGHRECGPACEGDVTSVNNIDPCLGTACFGYWFSGDEWGRGWTAQDTEAVLFTVLALAGGMAAPEVIAAAPGAIEAVGWKALEWTLCHQTLARILGIGGAAAADGDPTNEVRGLLEAGRFQKHHIFPRALRDWFASKGIDIDKYTVVLETTTHLAGVHGRGGLVGPGNVTLPGRWNQLWQVFKDANPNATPKEIYQFAGWLMDRFGLSGLPIVPYD